MKKLVFTVLAACAAAPVIAAPNVGVSIGINQPGVYGRVDIGNYPQPALVYAEPVIVAPPRVVVQREPVYLYVPPGHQKQWRRYCGRYNACGQPVYFVQENWVRERWEHEHHDERREHGDRRDDGPRGKHWDDDRGEHGKGHKHGKSGKGNKHDD